MSIVLVQKSAFAILKTSAALLQSWIQAIFSVHAHAVQKSAVSALGKPDC